MHTHKEGLLRHWKVQIKGRYYATVFVWDSVGRLQKENKLEDNVGGYAVTTGYVLTNDGPLMPKKFAEIHLYDGGFGAGVAAHEIQHVVNNWILANRLDVDVDDEEIATVVGNMNKAFWDGYYSPTGI